jgi:hypothetical protein
MNMAVVKQHRRLTWRKNTNSPGWKKAVSGIVSLH